MPSNHLSAGCTGTILYALWMSSLASIAPELNSRICLIALPTDMKLREHSSWLIPSLTLALSGEDRSTMILHFPGWWFFGITPNLLEFPRFVNKWANYSLHYNFLLKVLLHHQGILLGWPHVPLGTNTLGLRGVKPNAKTIGYSI